jgi:hypothetical protein
MRRDDTAAVCANLVAAGIPSYAFACECGRSGCAERVELTTGEFAGTDPVVAPPHAS